MRHFAGLGAVELENTLVHFRQDVRELNRDSHMPILYAGGEHVTMRNKDQEGF